MAMSRTVWVRVRLGAWTMIHHAPRRSRLLENYQKLQSRITTNQAAMLAMSQGARKLSADMKGIPPKATQREIGQLNARAERLQQKLDRDHEALSKLRPQLINSREIGRASCRERV